MKTVKEINNIQVKGYLLKNISKRYEGKKRGFNEYTYNGEVYLNKKRLGTFSIYSTNITTLKERIKSGHGAIVRGRVYF